MVRVEVADPAPGIMVPGENEQFKVLGRPRHESAIGVFRVPDFIAAVTVTLPDSPEGTLTALGDALKEIVAGGGGGGGGVLDTVLAQVGL
jgi:hypothetical protein